jgi:hypothetical protein
MKWLFSLALLGAASCSALPTDPDGTLERVRAEHLFRVGIVGAGPGALAAQQRAFLARVSQSAGARPTLRSGPFEPLLLDLEAGKLDLVVGIIAPDTPWRSEVAILQPLGETAGGNHLLLAPIARNGENAWIMLLEREARRVRAAS